MKYFLAIIAVLIILTVYFIFRPGVEYRVQNIEKVQDTPVETPASPVIETPDPEAERRAAMQAEYEALEKARRNLEQRLGRMKAVLWGQKFTPEKNREITETLQSGYALLKNKKLLGAYHSLEEIKTERGHTEFIFGEIKALEAEIKARKTRQQDNG